MTIQMNLHSDLPLLGRITTDCRFIVTSYLQFIDNSTLGFLIVLAFVAWFLASLFLPDNAHCRITAKILAGFSFVSHLGSNIWRAEASDVPTVLPLIIQSTTSALIVLGFLYFTLFVSTIVLQVIDHSLTQPLLCLFRKIHAWWKDYRDRLAEKRIPEPEPPQPRSELIQTLSGQARHDFDLEQAVINETEELEQDEREALLQAAKQRYIQRLNEILQ